MRVMQLIDSLHPGGAERMAVAFANELIPYVENSYLCVSRQEGILNFTIDENVGYCFLNKRSKVDAVAFQKLIRFVKMNKIEIIHAHSSSFFYATLLKMIKPSLKLIWHDHYGNNAMLEERKYLILKWSSRFFSAIISVNEILKDWAIKNLRCDKVVFLNNFISESKSEKSTIKLKGDAEYRIVCLANLRPQKDHINLLEAFQLLKQRYPLASLHLIGKINYDSYYEEVTSFISKNNIDSIHIYGSQSGVLELLRSAKIGVLSSKSEGLPVSLLEYGLAGLPVVCTDVGQCREVVNNYGKIVPPNDSIALSKSVMDYFEDRSSMVDDGKALLSHIELSYSFKSVHTSLLDIYKTP